ncbi:PREDICTED: uncharacterized protein LOC108557718 [Nicrophorus vespilloides]|uniref:Uncharacterized protein LOC108557718 n=1 Tax=Nicrophorus vespilloides TaxID=110193 RepID=A0ABM1M5K0_NICVS|nr:PREDICTED: uncharacterized protein LOC108557718 [Nicrophorus vespilloides]
MRQDDRIKLRIFEGQTTNRNDFRRLNLEKDVEGIKRPEQERIETIERCNKRVFRSIYQQECHESFTKYKKDVYVPFDLLWKHQRIGRKNVNIALNTGEPRDDFKEEAIKSRPRLYISPAFSVDDVPDKKMRDLLIAFMYTTDFRKAEMEATGHKCNVRAGLPIGQFQREVPLTYPPVPHEWTKGYSEWDRKQRRACVDPTEKFWETKDPPVICGACVDRVKGIVPTEVRDEIASAISDNKLRLPHDRLMQGYTGYRPDTAKVVPLRKTELPVVHPMLTTSQAVTRRYEEDFQCRPIRDANRRQN